MNAKTKFAIITLAALVMTGCASNRKSEAKPYIEINGRKVEVELARTQAEQIKGLSGHKPLGNDQGMLFIFSELTPRSFWMKNMLFPIDIIWIKDNSVIKVSPDLQPEGDSPQKTYQSDVPANYVLEVPAGWAKKNKITAGANVVYHYAQ